MKEKKPLLALAVLLLLVINFVSGYFAKRYMTDITDYTSIGFWLVLLNFTLLTIIVLAYKKYANWTWADIGLGKPNNWWQPVLVAIGLYLAFSIYGKYISPYIMQLGERPNISHLLGIRQNLPGLIVSLILVWVTAAFLEELIFRGFLLNAFDRLLGSNKWSVWAAVVFSSVIFGLSHAYQGLTGILGTGTIGLIFGIAFVLNSKRLWPLIFMHGVIDTIAFISIYNS